MSLTILITCCEEDDMVEKSMQDNYDILLKYPIVIVDKKGGDKFIQFEQQGNYDIQYFDQDTSFWFARRFGLEFVKTEYVLCLDVDTVLPKGYVEQAIWTLELDPKVAVVALNYSAPTKQDHLAFGTSIWRTDLLKELYDWRLIEQPYFFCECKHMWNKVAKKGLKVETLPMEATHLKDITERFISQNNHIIKG